MPECVYYSKNGFCTQSPECQYLHVDPQSKIPRCPFYDLGYCKKGPQCERRHVARDSGRVCLRYLSGFCPRGSGACSEAHVVWGDNVLEDPVLRAMVVIRRDYEINTRKLDELLEKRLNDAVNGPGSRP